MYFIAKGSCEITVRTNYDIQIDENDESVQKIGLLGEGAHFGEIALIYGCKRTATVASTNYCTLASLSKK
jgi:CRP-like cAMP-binding protein